jgi:hypothetical protein
VTHFHLQYLSDEKLSLQAEGKPERSTHLSFMAALESARGMSDEPEISVTIYAVDGAVISSAVW